MTRIKMPTKGEILQLANVRSDICISIYVETSPLKQDSDYCRIELKNMMNKAFDTLEAEGYDKRRVASLKELMEDMVGDDEFCENQANSLAVLATPDTIRIYRLANMLSNQLEISDRFYIKPLLRALTFRHAAYILALSENQARVVELIPDALPQEVKINDLPKDAHSALGLRSMTSSLRKLGNASEGRKTRLSQYSKIVDEAIRPLTLLCDYPLILVATEPIASIFRSVSSSCLLEETIPTNPDHLSISELAEIARPLLDKYYAKELEEVKSLYEERAGQRRTLTNLQEIAKAATYGMVSLALVDFDYIKTGYVDNEGNLTFSEETKAYGIIDEIAKRCLENGANVMAVRSDDMIGDTGIAAILRYPIDEKISR